VGGFCDFFFRFFLYIGKIMGYRVSAASVLIRVAPLCTFNEIEFLLKKKDVPIFNIEWECLTNSQL
jgi:hypothetical protein